MFSSKKVKLLEYLKWDAGEPRSGEGVGKVLQAALQHARADLQVV